MPVGFKLREQKRRGRPIADKTCTLQAVLDDFLNDPISRGNPLSYMLANADRLLSKQRTGQARIHIQAAAMIVDACEAALKQQLLPMDILAPCQDCGHARIQHVEDGHCQVCFYGNVGAGYHCCRAYNGG